MANPSGCNRGQASIIAPGQSPPRRKLPLSKVLAVFLFAITSISIISIRTFIKSVSTSTPAFDLISPQSQYNAKSTIASNLQSPIVIAHAISLIKCSKSSSVTGFLDAAAILRHSIHKNSIHGKNSKSKYSYQMYAIVHPSCAPHSTPLIKLGYELLVKDHPVKKEDIRGTFLRDHIESENCCGSAEFIKLYGE